MHLPENYIIAIIAFFQMPRSINPLTFGGEIILFQCNNENEDVNSISHLGRKSAFDPPNIDL